VSLTPVANWKIFNHKSLIILFGHLWEEELTYTFCLQVHFKVSAAWYCSHYLPPVSDTGGNFAAGVVDNGGNLPLVSTTLAKLVAKFATGVFDTGGAPWLTNIFFFNYLLELRALLHF
jgi:hypothetical protein